MRRAKEGELVMRSQRLVAAAFADQLGLLRQAALARTVAALAQSEAQLDFAASASRCAAPCAVQSSFSEGCLMTPRCQKRFDGRL